MNDHGNVRIPQSRKDEVIESAWNDGLLAGVCALVPAGASVYYATKTYAGFRKATNASSRTALVIMPALFAFAFSSELKLDHKQREMASVYEHNSKMGEWIENGQDQSITRKRTEIEMKESARISDLYKKSIADSGVRIVPGNKLGLTHKIANFWQENPFKMLGALSAPTVLYIFKMKSEKSHLQVQSMVMHTRVYGQFIVLSLLMSIMGFKAYMDQYGNFITQLEADRRAEDMARARREFQESLKLNRERAQRMKNFSKTLKDDRIEKNGQGKKKEKVVIL